MLPRTITLSLAAASANNIAQAQTPGGAGNLTLNGALVSGGVATLDVARRILVTTVANESAKTLTITGTDRNGRTITETVTGPNASTAFTNQDFKTVTQVAVSAAFTGNVTIGTNGVGSTRWSYLNPLADAFQVGLRVKVTGTVTYSIEKTYDELMGSWDGGVFAHPAVPTVFNDPILVGVSASGETVINNPCSAVRATILSGTGSIEMIVTQAG